MLLKTSQESLKKIFQYVSKVPFAKSIIHSLSEAASGKSIVFFSLHQIINKNQNNFYVNPRAFDVEKLTKSLMEINRTIPFISLSEAVDMLKGEQKFVRSHGVLVLEVPYVKTLKILLPILEKLSLPVCIMLSVNSISTGEFEWVEEIIYRFHSSNKMSFSVSYIDRSFPLFSVDERNVAARNIIDHLIHCRPAILKQKLAEMRNALGDSTVTISHDRVATIAQLKELGENPLVHFGAAGYFHWPFYEINPDEVDNEIITAKEKLSFLFGEAFIPVFYYPLGFEKKHNQDIVDKLIINGYEAAITHSLGICHPGDNMFRLPCLPLDPTTKSFDQYQLMGLSDAIEEFLLVTLAQDKNLS
ncbi:MAG: hypothetical protein KC505_04105 [Myxococcales bacterium]|nr:hypothetical protein [Myxococcales bacterium]USN50189.1 MAG: hypothetical protein H6731_07935 [Myxococcales bacterium]